MGSEILIGDYSNFYWDVDACSQRSLNLLRMPEPKKTFIIQEGLPITCYIFTRDAPDISSTKFFSSTLAMQSNFIGHPTLQTWLLSKRPISHLPDVSRSARTGIGRPALRRRLHSYRLDIENSGLRTRLRRQNTNICTVIPKNTPKNKCCVSGDKKGALCG